LQQMLVSNSYTTFCEFEIFTYIKCTLQNKLSINAFLIEVSKLLKPHESPAYEILSAYY